MAVSLGGQDLLDPAELHSECLDAGLPVADWLGKANSFSCPLGKEPGHGHALITKGQLDKLDLNKQYDLIFDDGRKKAPLKQLVIGWTRCVTPGLRGDKSAAHLVDLYDRRVLLRLVPIDKAYNRLDCAGQATEAAPAGSGSGACSGSGGAGGWTWSQMVCDIWKMLPGLGAYPGLPFTPQDKPYNLAFYGGYAYDALNAALDRLGCALQLNPLTDKFGIVRVGAEDRQVQKAFDELDARRVWDYEPPDKLTLSNVPAKVRVLFRRYPAPKDNRNPFYTVELSAPPSVKTPTAAGSSVVLADDMPARASTGTPTNAGDLQARAAERRDDYYRLLLGGLNRVFTGVVNDARLMPGPQVKAVAWRDVGGADPDTDGPKGLATEVYRGLAVLPPYDLAKFAAPQYPAACAVMHSGSGSGADTTVEGGNCCFSGVRLKQHRCFGGKLQDADVCLRMESGHLLLRDEQCRVVPDAGCCGGIKIEEYDVITFGDPAQLSLQVSIVCVRVEGGRVVLRDVNGEIVGGRECLGTGAYIRTLVCRHGAILQSRVCVSLECGRLVLRDENGELVADGGCCDEPDDCAALSAGYTWHDTGCSCGVIGCNFPGDAGGFPTTIDWYAVGAQGGDGCEGVSCAGQAHWTDDSVGLGFWPDGPPTGIPNPAGYVFDYVCNGVRFHYLWYCVGLNPDFPSNPRWVSQYWHDGHPDADSDCEPGMTLIAQWGGDISDPGAGEFSQDLFHGSTCPLCHGFMYFFTATAA